MIDPDATPDPLLDLFRAEVRESAAALTRGLLEVDRFPDGSPPSAGMAEAARTVRGAARILNLEPAARLGAALEDLLAAAGSGAVALTAADRDLCQRVVSLLGELDRTDPAAWAVDRAAAIDGLAGELAGRLNPTAVYAPAPPVPVAIIDAKPPPAQKIIEPESAAAEPIPHVDPSLLELFQEEMRSHAGALSAGLVELERDPTNPQRIEPLMRAAHSLKGACRIVGLDPAVALAHEMEDGFVAAQAGKVRITPAAIDTFLRTADVLGALGQDHPDIWTRAHSAEVRELRAAVAAFNRGEAVADLPAGDGLEGGPLAPRAVLAGPAHESSEGVSSPPLAERADHPPTPSTAEPTESVVRVTAQSLNRLMSLAGESLVQSRWLQPFTAALLELRKLQDQIAARLDSAGQRLPGTANGDPIRAALADAARLSARSRQVLIERTAEFEEHAGRAEDLNTRLYREVIVSRMRPFADGAHGLPRLARDTARRVGKAVRFDLIGQATEVDRDILEKLEAPLTHLIRNAIDHGIEPADARAGTGKPAEGLVRVEARHRGGMLSIVVSDDGGGIDVEKLRKKVADRGLAAPAMAARMTDAELLEFLFLPGFSTASQVTEVSGRGVGLDVVQDTVRKLGGSVQITTALGTGTSFHLLLPLTLSVVRAVLVEVAGEMYAFPHNRIDRLLRVPPAELQSLQHRQFVTVDGRSVGLVLASQLFDAANQPPPADGDLPVVLLSDPTGTYGLAVDSFRGEQDLVVRPLDPRLGKVPNVAAAAILDDGSPVLIADVEDLIRSMDQYIQTGTLWRFDPERHRQTARKRVLVVDDSITVREVQKQILRGRGYDVEVAVDGADGWNKVRAERFDLVVSDVDMPRMTGLEFVRKVRDDAKLRDLPVVIVSYKDREEDRLRGLEAGANHYLTKSSFHDESFADAVAALIGPG